MFRTLSMLLLCQFSMIVNGFSQVKIGNNPTTINVNSVLELESTNEGFVPPRLSLSAVTSSTPLTSALFDGTLVYNTNPATTGGSGIGLYIWYNSKWNFLSTGSASGNYWSITGNTGTTPSSSAYGTTVNNNFIGTTDSRDFVFATNSLERMRIASGGYVGIGTTTPNKPLFVEGPTGNSNVITIENTNTGGYSSLDAYDNTGTALSATFGYGNTGVGDARFVGRAYINAYANDFILTDNVSASTYAFLVSKTNGFVGIGTKTPQQPIETGYTNGTIRIDGLKSGNSYSSSSTTANSSLVYVDNATGDLYSLPTVNNATLVTNGTGVPSWSTSGSGITGTGVTNIIKTTFTVNLGTLGANSQAQYTVTVSGVKANASVILNPQTTNLTKVAIMWAYASGTNTIKFMLANVTAGSTGGMGNITFDVTVIQ